MLSTVSLATVEPVIEMHRSGARANVGHPIPRPAQPGDWRTAGLAPAAGMSGVPNRRVRPAHRTTTRGACPSPDASGDRPNGRYDLPNIPRAGSWLRLPAPAGRLPGLHHTAALGACLSLPPSAVRYLWLPGASTLTRLGRPSVPDQHRSLAQSSAPAVRSLRLPLRAPSADRLGCCRTATPMVCSWRTQTTPSRSPKS